MTDDLYSAYGGELEDSTEVMRNLAYISAERAVSEELNTYLVNTTVTGSYSYQPRILLQHNYINYLDVVRFYDFDENLYYTITGTANFYASVFNNTRGQLDIAWFVSNCGCSSSYGKYPYRIDVVYQTGLPSGTVYNSNIMIALVELSKIAVHEFIGYGNESSGDVGVQSFKNQEYSEQRVGLIRTSFGTSAKAQRILNLLQEFRKLKMVGL